MSEQPVIADPKSVEEGFPMSNKPYSETVKSAFHDPVWWIRLLAAVAALIFLLAKLLGFDAPIVDVAFNVAIILSVFTFILEAVRGRSVGSDKPMRTVERVVNTVASAFVMVLFFISLLRSFGIMLW